MNTSNFSQYKQIFAAIENGCNSCC